MIADFGRDCEVCFVAPAARARRTSASVRVAPNAPRARKLRRLMPSQKRWREPENVSMTHLPGVGDGIGGEKSAVGGIVRFRGTTEGILAEGRRGCNAKTGKVGG